MTASSRISRKCFMCGDLESPASSVSGDIKMMTISGKTAAFVTSDEGCGKSESRDMDDVKSRLAFKAKMEEFDRLSPPAALWAGEYIMGNRTTLYDDCFSFMENLTSAELKSMFGEGVQGLFFYEPGSGPGMTREFMISLTNEIFGPGKAYWTLSDNGLAPVVTSGVAMNQATLKHYRFHGRILALMIKLRYPTSIRFASVVLKALCNQENELTPDDWKAFEQIERNRASGVRRDALAEKISAGGRSSAESGESKLQLAALFLHKLLAFRKGLHDLIDKSAVSVFTPKELDILIESYKSDLIDIDEWKLHTSYKNCSESDEIVNWFWTYISSLSESSRADLLYFVTSARQVPCSGMCALSVDDNGPFTIAVIDSEDACTRLPSSKTCFNTLQLPRYKSYLQLKRMFDLVLEIGVVGFHFA